MTRYSLSPDVVDLISFCTKKPLLLCSIKWNIWIHTVEWHIQKFEEMAKTLCGYTGTCVISFIDIYKKVVKNFPEARAVSDQDKLAIGKAFIETASRYGMTIKPCAEGTSLAAYGADCSGCMTVKTYETALHCNLTVPKKGKESKKNGECACLLGNDIGAYDTCGHLCRYCYANTDADLVRQNMKKHDPKSPFLLGNLNPEDVIHEADQKKLDRQADEA